MKIYIASDHAGFEMKENLKAFLKARDYDVQDCGPESFVDGDDYPDYISKVAKEISENPTDKGIVIGLSGQGEAMVANRFKSVRAGVCNCGNNLREVVKLLREHNDANVLSLGAKFLAKEEAESAVEIFLNTEFSGDERHVRRNGKIDSQN